MVGHTKTTLSPARTRMIVWHWYLQEWESKYRVASARVRLTMLISCLNSTDLWNFHKQMPSTQRRAALHSVLTSLEVYSKTPLSAGSESIFRYMGITIGWSQTSIWIDPDRTCGFKRYRHHWQLAVISGSSRLLLGYFDARASIFKSECMGRSKDGL